MLQLPTFRLYLLGMILLFAGYITLEYNRPQPPDWTPSYVNKDKIPFGTYVLYDQLPRLLGTDSIAAVRLPVYNQLTGQSLEQAPAAGPEPSARPDSVAAPVPAERSRTLLPLRPGPANYLFINTDFELSRPDALALLQFVARGNDALVAAESWSGAGNVLRDSLGLSLKNANLPTRRSAAGLLVADSVELRFTNSRLSPGRLRLSGGAGAQRLVVDSGRVGRTLATDAQGRAVFIRLDHGRGHFYVCSTPAAFTNYYLLRTGGAGFAAAALAYLPARRIWWDEYQKQGPVGEQSLLRVVFAHEALRVAYYLSLIGALLFVLVEARRRQRIIPTLKPLPNTTLLFTRTVAGLYRQGRSHEVMAEKKVGLFRDYLRNRFQETNPDFSDADFRERLSQKSGLPRPRVDELLRLVNFARTAPRITDRELLLLSKALRDFKREVNR